MLGSLSILQHITHSQLINKYLYNLPNYFIRKYQKLIIINTHRLRKNQGTRTTVQESFPTRKKLKIERANVVNQEVL